MNTVIDVVTVTHSPKNEALADQLEAALAAHEPADRYTATRVSNREVNRGFAAACNIGARDGKAPIIGFINPDATIEGQFIDQVTAVFAASERVVICGNSYDKPNAEIAAWGLHHWVCGACLFVRRDWFEKVGGFDKQFVWGWEETDLARRAERLDRWVYPIEPPLPIAHQSPSPGEETPADITFKNRWFSEGRRLYEKKWFAIG